ncbi:MAG: hypothetical protein KUG77_29035, partial [Nannocystaceae bacterium]|nr:hypothetical protein [Nannocystaceae bacterium]
RGESPGHTDVCLGFRASVLVGQRAHRVWRAVPLFALAAGLLVSGCDAGSGPGAGARSGSNSDEGPGEVGGGFVPSPDCSYDCVDATEDETVCVQTCADDCRTTVLRRVKTSLGSVDVIESQHELCPEQLPAPELWPLTCELLYSGWNSDCEESHSAQACEVAFDLCLP